jgi:hypothetical protein
MCQHSFEFDVFHDRDCPAVEVAALFSNKNAVLSAVYYTLLEAGVLYNDKADPLSFMHGLHKYLQMV